MKNTKSMISTIYETLHANDLDELENIYKNWASEYENDVINLAGYVGHLITSDLLLKYLNNAEAKVLDAGCGTGRVGIELVRRGIDSVGVDLDPKMLEAARQKAPTLEWFEADLQNFSLGRSFDIAVLAGNVMIFVLPGSEEQVVRQIAHHLRKGGLFVSGFSLDADGLGLDQYDQIMKRLGLMAAGRWSTWERDPFTGGNYAVSAHRITYRSISP